MLNANIYSEDQCRSVLEQTTFDVALPWGTLQGEDDSFSSQIIDMFQDAIKDEAAEWHSFMEKHIADSLEIVDDWAQQQGAGGVLSEMLAAASSNRNNPRRTGLSSDAARKEDLRAQVQGLREQRKAASAKEVRALMAEVEAVGGSTLRLRSTLERAISQVPALVRATIAPEPPSPPPAAALPCAAALPAGGASFST